MFRCSHAGGVMSPAVVVVISQVGMVNCSRAVDALTCCEILFLKLLPAMTLGDRLCASGNDGRGGVGVTCRVAPHGCLGSLL